MESKVPLNRCWGQFICNMRTVVQYDVDTVTKLVWSMESRDDDSECGQERCVLLHTYTLIHDLTVNTSCFPKSTICEQKTHKQH
jgi:hypothetical protein